VELYALIDVFNANLAHARRKRTKEQQLLSTPPCRHNFTTLMPEESQAPRWNQCKYQSKAKLKQQRELLLTACRHCYHLCDRVRPSACASDRCCAAGEAALAAAAPLFAAAAPKSAYVSLL
jgi:hypothetical protein